MITAKNIQLPELPEPDGSMTIVIAGCEVEVDTYRASTLDIHRRACIDAYREQYLDPGLDFHIQERGGIPCLIDSAGGVRQASDEEHAMWRALQIDADARRNDVWQRLAAALYQVAGTYDMPVRVLDALSAAANGEPFEHLIEPILPIDLPIEIPPEKS